jgi:ubiquinone/menaquinone biosynthesis C-methylase UbiE
MEAQSMFGPDGPTIFELAHQALSSTTRGYDLLAKKFEHTPYRTPDALLNAIVEVANEVGIEDRPVESALDLCCGTGAAMRHLRPHCTQRIVGIDLSQGMLDEARRLLDATPGDVPVEFIQGDVMQMDFREEFDLMTCCGAFGHILEPQQDDFARRVRAGLKPDGRFIFITAEMPPFWSKPHLLARGFNAAMHLRNALIKPPFIMFYLTFTLERAREVLGRQRFELDVRRPYKSGPYEKVVVVSARRSG